MNESIVRAYEEGLLMPRWGYVAAAFALFFIGFFGFFLNLMAILLMIKDRQLWNPLNLVLLNLVCSDFSVSILGNPLTLTSALYHQWVFGHTMCVIYGFFMALLGICSITTLTVLAFERYMMVSRAINSNHLSFREAVYCIVFIWVYSLALTTPPLFGWGNYVSEAANISCSVNWHEQSMNTLTYILFLFATGLVIPMAVISFSYINIIRIMKQNSERLGRVNRAEAKVTSMVFVMIIAFIIAWAPYSIFALMEQFATGGIISPGAGVIPALVAKSSICYNPIIYVGMNTQFRQSIVHLFTMENKRATSQTEKHLENTQMTSQRNSQGNTFSNKLISENITNGQMRQIIIVNKQRTSLHDIYGREEVVKREKEDNNLKSNDICYQAEVSDETILEYYSSNEYRKQDLLEENNSPILQIISTDKQIFSKTPLLTSCETSSSDDETNTVFANYHNSAFVDHSSDTTIGTTASHLPVGLGRDKSDKKQNASQELSNKQFRQSRSLDLSSVPKVKRQLSVETKDGTFPASIVIYSSRKENSRNSINNFNV